MNKSTIIVSLLSCLLTSGQCQRNEKLSRQMDAPFLTDSASTLFFPVRYSEEMFSTNKIAMWGDYYANIIVYDFVTDTYQSLFPEDTYIASFHNIFSSTYLPQPRNITKNWVFLLVKQIDTNKSGRIDEKDPYQLFVTTPSGKELKKLTTEVENAVSFIVYEEQGFVLVRLQRDSNNDKSFKSEDKDFYYRKINLKGLNLGKPIEIN